MKSLMSSRRWLENGRRRSRVLVCFVAALLAMTKVVLAEEAPAKPWEPSLGADFDFHSRYVWRGIAYSEFPVFQPTLWASFGDLTASAWFNFNFAHEEDLMAPDGLSEIDPSLSYDFEVWNFAVQPSLIFYLYPDQDYAVNTGEAAIAISRDVGNFTLKMNHQWDIMEYAGYYFGQWGAEYHQEIKAITLTGGLLVGTGSPGFNEAYFGKKEWAFNLIQADVNVSKPLTPWLDGLVGMTATVIPDSTLADQVDDRWTIGGNAMLSFHFPE